MRRMMVCLTIYLLTTILFLFYMTIYLLTTILFLFYIKAGILQLSATEVFPEHIGLDFRTWKWREILSDIFSRFMPMWIEYGLHPR